jgi:hypothetical protein
MWTELICSRYASTAGCCEHGNEQSSSMKVHSLDWPAHTLSASQEGFCFMELAP